MQTVSLKLTLDALFVTVPVAWDRYIIEGKHGLCRNTDMDSFEGWTPNANMNGMSVPNIINMACLVYNKHYEDCE